MKKNAFEKPPHLTKTCIGGHSKTIGLTPLEAMFELYNFKQIWDTPCVVCGAKTESLGLSKPPLTAELLEIWASTPNYHFWVQDEDIFLAEMEHLPLLLQALDSPDFPKGKTSIIISALCVLWYDNWVFSEEDYTPQEQKMMLHHQKILRPLLLERKEMILLHKNAVSGYIWKEIKRLLG